MGPTWAAQATTTVARLVLALVILAGSLDAALAGAAAAGGRERKADVAQRKRDGDRHGGDLAIVALPDGVDPRAAAREMGVVPVRVYTHVFSGFAADLSTAVMARSARTGGVKAIAPDIPMAAEGQVTPTGVQRIGLPGAGAERAARKGRVGERARAAKGAKTRQDARSSKGKQGNKDRKHRNDGQGQPIPDGPGADVAILDSGVTASKDLPVAGGVSCVESKPTCVASSATDLVGHGTHVAGIVAARDNDLGVVGVAPEARIWSVRVLVRGNNGAAVGWTSDVIAGLDWVYQNRSAIDVANLSLGGWKSGAGNPNDPYRLAIKRVSDAGIPVVVAAGNAGQDVLDNGAGMQFAPAAYPEAIAVSAFADADGRPGGTGGATCSGDQDDAFWAYSNRGSAVDIAAPGICILSLTPDGGTTTMSGTSMAAPHVAGALALFVAANPDASAAQAREWLLSVAAADQSGPTGFRGDPDQDHEPVLRLGP